MSRRVDHPLRGSLMTSSWKGLDPDVNLDECLELDCVGPVPEIADVVADK